MEKFKGAQRVAEIVQEQLCDSRERHDKVFLGMQETMLKVKNAQRFAETAQEQVCRPNGWRKVHTRKSTTVESVIDAFRQSTLPPRNV